MDEIFPDPLNHRWLLSLELGPAWKSSKNKQPKNDALSPTSDGLTLNVGPNQYQSLLHLCSVDRSEGTPALFSSCFLCLPSQTGAALPCLTPGSSWYPAQGWNEAYWVPYWLGGGCFPNATNRCTCEKSRAVIVLQNTFEPFWFFTSGIQGLVYHSDKSRVHQKLVSALQGHVYSSYRWLQLGAFLN